MALIIYKGEDPLQYLKGKTIFVFADPSGCSECVVLKSKLEVFHQGFPDVNFIFWDFGIYKNVKPLMENFVPWAFPYIKGYYNENFVEASYSSQHYILSDIISKINLFKNDLEGR